MQKPRWKSKGMWSGFLLMVSVILKIAATGVITQEDLTVFLLGLGILGIRDAIG